MCFKGAAQQLDGVVTTYNFTVKGDNVIVAHDYFNQECELKKLPETIRRGELYSVFYETLKDEAVDSTTTDKEIASLKTHKKSLDAYLEAFDKAQKESANKFVVLKQMTAKLFKDVHADKSGFSTVGEYLSNKMGNKYKQDDVMESDIASAKKSLKDFEKDAAAEVNSDQDEMA